LTSGNQKIKHHLNLKVKRVLQSAASFGLTAAFLYIAFRDVNFDDVLKILSQASVFWIVLLIISVMSSHFLRAVRWKVILHSVKPNTSLKNLFGALMVGYGVNCVIPRLGEISRAVLAGKWEGLSRSSMFGTVIVERVIDTIFLCIAVFISLVIGTEDISTKFPWLKSALYISMIALFAAILILIFMIRYKEKFYGIIVKFFGRFSEKLGHKLAYIFQMLTTGFSSLKGTKNYSMTIFLSVVIMLLYALSSYIGFFTIGMEKIHPVNFSMAWVLMSISAIGVVIPTPGATGSYHALAKSTLVLLFGFGESISLAYAILTHIISYLLFIITSLLFFFIINRQHENLIKVVETELDDL
jgi:glycosyltransferase 2 family protein